MSCVVIEERGHAPRLSPVTLPSGLHYTVRTVVVAVHDPATGVESMLYLGPRAFLEEFGPSATAPVAARA